MLRSEKMKEIKDSIKKLESLKKDIDIDLRDLQEELQDLINNQKSEEF